MDDSDEYGFDDIDEATFQVIDAIESSHISASQAPKQTSVVPRPAAGPSHNSSSITTTKYGPPLAKRVRTDGWSGTEPSRLDNSTAATTRPATKTPATRTETLDDIPDISVSIDGSYFVAPGKSKDVTKPIPGPSGTTSTKPGAVLQKVAGVQKASGVVPAPPKPSNTAQVSGRGPSNGHVHGPPLGSRPPNLPINKNPVVIPPKVSNFSWPHEQLVLTLFWRWCNHEGQATLLHMNQYREQRPSRNLRRLVSQLLLHPQISRR